MTRATGSKTRDPKWYEGNNGEGKQTKGQTFVPARFVRGELSQEEKDHCKRQAWKPDEVLEQIDQLLPEGYKFTVSWDSGNDCYGAWLVASREGHRHSGFILSGRGPTVLAALAVLLYKHYTKFDGQWPIDDAAGKLDAWG